MFKKLKKNWYNIAIWLVIMPLGAIAVAGMLVFIYKAIVDGI
jgi:hypothetical protein